MDVCDMSLLPQCKSNLCFLPVLGVRFLAVTVWAILAGSMLPTVVPMAVPWQHVGRKKVFLMALLFPGKPSRLRAPPAQRQAVMALAMLMAVSLHIAGIRKKAVL